MDDLGNQGTHVRRSSLHAFIPLGEHDLRGESYLRRILFRGSKTDLTVRTVGSSPRVNLMVPSMVQTFPAALDLEMAVSALWVACVRSSTRKMRLASQA